MVPIIFCIEEFKKELALTVTQIVFNDSTVLQVLAIMFVGD